MHRRAVILVLAAGCGRLGFDGGADSPDGDVSRVPATVCQTESWTSLAFADTDVDLAVVPTATGVTAVWVATAGSAVTAANIDASWRVTGAPGGSQTKAGTYRRVSAAIVDGTLITSEGGYGDYKIDVVPGDLGAAGELTCPVADQAVAPAMLKAGADRVSMIAVNPGMTVLPFDAGFNELASQLQVTSPGTAIGMAATQVGTAAEVVWSTADACFVEYVTDKATGTHAESAAACASPELASDGTHVALVFEAPGGVFLSKGTPMAISAADAILLAANGTSPRIAYDGQKYWVAYRDGGGALALGYVATDGTLVSTPLGVSAPRDAYALAVVGGRPWLFWAATDGLHGQQFCVP